MKQLEMLESELILLQDNIKRIKDYQKQNKDEKWNPYNSHVIGEFKHRIVALKQRLTLASRITTRDLFK